MSVEEGVPPVLKPLETLRFFRAKGVTFGFAWQDVWQEEHARAFTVAKAMQRDLLEDIRAAVDKAIDEGQTLAQFQKDLRPLLEAKGWWGRKSMIDPQTGEQKVVQLGSPNRLKTIYQVNMRTSQAAGRWERIQRQKKVFPFLEYKSVMDGSERPQHHDWNGTLLPVDDSWWDTHYPPCGWKCRCNAVPRNQRMMDAKGLSITQEPKVFPSRQWINKRTGEVHQVEEGIDPGFSYNVGKAALDPLTPAPIGPEGAREIGAAALSSTGLADLQPFFSPFGLNGPDAVRKGKIFLDDAGWPLAISGGWFRDAAGGLSPPPQSRLKYLAAAAEALADPQEIRWRWVTGADGSALLMRRYIGDSAVVDVGRAGWRFFAAGEPGFDRAALARGERIWAQ